VPRVPAFSSLRTRILLLGGLFSAAIISVVLITAYVVVATGMAGVADATNARLARRTLEIYTATRDGYERDARSAGLTGAIYDTYVSRKTLEQMPSLFASPPSAEAQYVLYGPGLKPLWASDAKMAKLDVVEAANRKAAVETGRPVSANTYANTLMSGLFSKANLGVFVTHVPLEFGGGEVGVMDVLYFPRREETVIDTTRLPMATLAVTAIGLSILMMNIALTGVLRLIDDLRMAADQVDADRLDVRLPEYGTHEIGELARSVNHLILRLRKRSEAQTRFVADASHELATPVAGIRGYIGILREWGVDDPAVREEAIGAIDRESNRMVRLTGELLSLVRSEGAAPEIVRESVDVNAMIRDVMASTVTRYMDKGVDFEGPDDEIRFYAWTDPDRFEQVLAILLDNAAKYTPVGGRVVAGGRRARGRRGQGGRHRPGDPPGQAAAHLRAFLSRRRFPHQPGRGIRSRAGHREAPDRDDRCRDRRRERGRCGHHVQYPAARRGGLNRGGTRAGRPALLGGPLRGRGRVDRRRVRSRFGRRYPDAEHPGVRDRPVPHI
jgi:signal transduction histidine kinase